MANLATPIAPATDLRALIAETRVTLRTGQERLRETYENKGSATTYLHHRARLVDGVLGAEFLAALRRFVEAPLSLLA